MKKTTLVLSMIFVLVLLAVGLTLPASAEDDIRSGVWGELAWELNKTTGELVISGEGAMDPFDATMYAEAWRASNSYIKSITVMSGVTNVSTEAFCSCENLTSVSLPNTLTSIDSRAFEECSSLETITIPDSVTVIGSGAFDFCTSLTSLVIPAGVTQIGGPIVRYCDALTSLTVAAGNSVYHSSGNCVIRTADKVLVIGGPNAVIPDDGSVTSIAEYAFSGCNGIVSLTVPSAVTEIGTGAFVTCNFLTEITFLGEVTSMGDETFGLCGRLESITLPNGLERIGARAFYQCTVLTDVVMPDTVTSIGDYAFNRCSALQNVEFSSGLTSIGAGAFNFCTALKNIELPEGVTSIGEQAFYRCTGLESIKLPDSVTEIGDAAFFMCQNLREFTFPKSITSIGEQVFQNCPNLVNISFAGCRELWYSRFPGNSIDITNVTFSKHTYAPWTSIDGQLHTGACACGATKTLNHAWDDGVVTTQPTHMADGVRTYTCEDCGATKTETIGKLTDHTYGKWEEHDEKQHKKSCACGDTVYEDHAMADGVCSACGKAAPKEEKSSGCSSSGVGIVFFAPVLGAACLMLRKKKKD